MRIDYTNHAGERRSRVVIPIRISFRRSKWHYGTQWIMDAHDCEDSMKVKDFALTGLPGWEIPEYVFPEGGKSPTQKPLFDDRRPT